MIKNNNNKVVQLTTTRINRAIREVSATRKKQDIKDPNSIGLYLRVTPNKRAWYSVTKAPNTGNARWSHLGDYPGVGIKDARNAASQARIDVRAGNAPVDVKRQKEREKHAQEEAAYAEQYSNENHTLRALVPDYESKKAKGNFTKEKHKMLRVYSGILDKPVKDVSCEEIYRITGDYQGERKIRGEAPSGHTYARSAFNLLRPMIRWGIKRYEWMNKDLREIECPHPPTTRPPGTLTISDILTLLPVLRRTQGHGHAMWFMVHTGVRLGEAVQAKKEQFDLTNGIWHLPPTMWNRGNRKHVCQFFNLPIQVVDFLKEIVDKTKSEYMFSLDNAPLRNWDRYTKEIKIESGVSHDWNRHDIRKFFATCLTEIGVPLHVMHKCLGHTHIEENRNHSHLNIVYNANAYDRERAEALKSLADYLESQEKQRTTEA